MMTQPNLIELQAGDDLIQIPPTTAVLVKGDANIAQTCERLRDAAPCRIAFVTPAVKRSRRRLAASLGLSSCFDCPCRVFHDEEAARRWLAS